MPWPIPQPADIADRASGTFEAELARVYQLRNGTPPPEPIDARSPRSVEAIYARVLGLSGFDLWLFLNRMAREVMPDTAQDWLDRHGAIWGEPQEQPVSAAGTIDVVCVAGGAMPADFVFTAPGGSQYLTINSGTIASAGTLAIGVSAAVAGAAGNLAPGVTLTAVSPLDFLAAQIGVVDADGITGGADIEDKEVWRGRILQRIRQRGASGNESDFEEWTQEVLPGCVVKAISPGAGLITVAIAVPTTNGPRVPTVTELGNVSAYLNDARARKPLGAPVVNVIAATLQPVDFSLHLNPDTPSIRTAATSALALYFAGGDITIGSTLDVSRSDDAVSTAFGGYNFDRAAPVGDVAPGTVTSLLTLGTVTFT